MLKNDRIYQKSIRTRIDGKTIEFFGKFPDQTLFDRCRELNLTIQFEPKRDYGREVDFYWHCVLCDKESRIVQGNSNAETIHGAIILAMCNLKQPLKRAVADGTFPPRAEDDAVSK